MNEADRTSAHASFYKCQFNLSSSSNLVLFLIKYSDSKIRNIDFSSYMNNFIQIIFVRWFSFQRHADFVVFTFNVTD